MKSKKNNSTIFII